jgi:hypothetical protein
MPKYEVCGTCQGEGKIVHPALSVWNESDRYEDPESFENMMNGDYDQTCPECDGKRVTTKVQEKRYAEKQQDHRTFLMESGIYPGSPDFY